MIFVPNATTGLNMVARSLDLRPGDEILTTDQEYGAMDRMWRFLCGKTGARYVPVPLPVPRTRVLFISHVTSSTGIILPVQELIRRARRRGIITILDAAHAPGHIPCHLHTLGCDFASGNWHKWLLAPKGSAFLYARVERQALLEPLIVSWGRQWAEPGPCPFVDEQEWTGTRDPSAWLATPACLDFRKAHAWAEVGARCRRMLRATRRRVLDATGLEPLCEPDPWLAQMATLPLPPGDPDRYQDRLRREFRIQAPVLRFAERNWVRISVQGYTTQEDLDAFVAAVRASHRTPTRGLIWHETKTFPRVADVSVLSVGSCLRPHGSGRAGQRRLAGGPVLHRLRGRPLLPLQFRSRPDQWR